MDDSPDDSLCLADRGFAWRRKGDYAKAILDFTAALRLKPDSNIFNERGYSHEQIGEMDEAAADYTEALKLDPDCLYALMSRGRIWYVRHNYQKAIDDLTSIIRLEPNADMFMRRASCWTNLRDFDKAIADCTAGLKLNPADVKILQKRSWARESKGEFGKAIDDLDEALQHDPENIHARNRRALILASAPNAVLRDGKRALLDATRACELTQWKEAESIVALAAAYAESGDFKNAVAWQSKSMEIESDSRRRAKSARALTLYQQHKPFRLRSAAKAVDSAETRK